MAAKTKYYKFESGNPKELCGYGDGRKEVARCGDVIPLTDGDRKRLERIYTKRPADQRVTFRQVATPAPDAPPDTPLGGDEMRTPERIAMEAAAGQLGIRVDPRWKDETLATKLDAAEKKAEAEEKAASEEDD